MIPLIRQQIRQTYRLVDRENRVGAASEKAAEAAKLTRGFNRKARRDAYRATRRRNNGWRKKFPVALP